MRTHHAIPMLIAWVTAVMAPHALARASPQGAQAAGRTRLRVAAEGNEARQPVLGLSKVTVDVTTLKSDRDRRDRFISRGTLATDSFPTVELVPTGIRGPPMPIPTTGTLSFELVGELTVKGMTFPTTWQVTATATASTAFTFADAGLMQPRVAVVLSVKETIRLEYDLRFIRERVAQR